ncbi:hypothetical protein LDENG_00072440 [Lucifuga dentata]|nr:hypothetical protein LDENG_00072440 [Lucifuga dentata]
MGAVWFRLVTILGLSCIALSGPERNGVVRRDAGGSITIQCRHSDPDQECLSLQRGLTGDENIFFKTKQKPHTIMIEFKNRYELKGDVPTVDILFKNLTSEDTGVYWCVFKKSDMSTSRYVDTKGDGSVLLVVTDAVQRCESSSKDLLSKDLVLLSVVISAFVLLLSICIIFSIWIKTKYRDLQTTKKPRRVPTNDVYEDMRGTIRR